eukprot:CAMPEP_0179432114 /NCGR_PEP_ID=MMETSP0799-20121207/16825_1 /TAXON_ID=46947 /ORGANISM="Geminigera cryophila, Strain CCMP2564" /LENGTH=625 /DNA_ID=CAMNT_0021209363 /DNA_START=179 /DNA_END=2054 /DNA_ORIENTATION=+
MTGRSKILHREILLVAALMMIVTRAEGQKHRTIWLESVALGEGDGITPYIMQSEDNISMFGGVRALVLDESEQSLNITYRNTLKEHTIVHIHGINPQKNDGGEDGFPFFASWLIAPGEAKNVVYSLRQTGTYFLHSHFNMQQEDGLVLPLIIRERALPPGYVLASQIKEAFDAVMQLEERCPYFFEDDKPKKCVPGQIKRVMSFMEKDWDEIESSVHDSFEKCDGAATDTDVLFMQHLVNGQQTSHLTLSQGMPTAATRSTSAATDAAATATQHVRVRILNIGAMTNYKVFLPSGSQIIKVDGSWVAPLSADYLWVAVGQRYEVLVSTLTASPTDTNTVTLTAVAETFSHTPQTHQIAQLHITFPSLGENVGMGGGEGGDGGERSGAVSGEVAGKGARVGAVSGEVSIPTGFAEDTLDNKLLRFPAESVDFSSASNVTYRITGDNGFMSFNGSGVMIPVPGQLALKCVGHPQELVVKRGQQYCITLVNSNADAHVFHLHGHVFTTVETSSSTVDDYRTNGPAQLAAWRDSVLVPGGNCSRRTVCFVANNVAGGYWPFHCHMNYHMASGMMLLIQYQDDNTISGEEAKVTGVCDMLGQVAKAKRRNVQLMIASAVSFVLACVGFSW